MSRKQSLTLLFLVAYVLLGLAGILAYAQFHAVDPPLIVHFDVYKGITLLGSQAEIYAAVAIAAALAVINTLLAFLLLRRQAVLAYLLGGISAVSALFVLIQVAALAALNL